MKTALCSVLLLAASPALAVEPTVDPTLRPRGFESVSQEAPALLDYSYGVMLRDGPEEAYVVDDGPGRYIVEDCGIAEAPHPYLSPDRVLARGWMEPVPPSFVLDGWAGTSFYLPMLP